MAKNLIKFNNYLFRANYSIKDMVISYLIENFFKVNDK